MSKARGNGRYAVRELRINHVGLVMAVISGHGLGPSAIKLIAGISGQAIVRQTEDSITVS